MKIFLSYTSADRDWAMWIGVTLRDAGHQVFVHEWEVAAGENIPAWMESRLYEAERMIGVFSPAYVAALHSNSERWAAYWLDPGGRKGFLVPIEVAEIDRWPPFAGNLRRLSLIGRSEAEAEAELLRFLEPPRPPDRRPRFPGGGGTATAGRGGARATSEGSTSGGFLKGSARLPERAPVFPALERVEFSKRAPKIENREDLERRLKAQPREVSVVVAARVAARVAPLLDGLWDSKRRQGARSSLAILLPLLRGMAAPWAAARYPARGAEVRASAAADAAAFASAAADAAAFAAAASAASAAASAAFAAAFAAAAFAAAASSAVSAARASSASSAAAVYAAISADLVEIDNGTPVEVLASRPLWLGSPQMLATDLERRWTSFAERLLSLDPDWSVWTSWYEDRLHGRPADEEKEFARLTIPEELWKDPAKANAEIRRRFDEIDARRADERSSFDEMVDTPADLVERAGHAENEVRIVPPREPIYRPAPAARFTRRGSVIDVLARPVHGEPISAEAAVYHRDAVGLVTRLSSRLSGTNAPERLTASLEAASQVLGAGVGDIQPDRLRRLSRKISADARTYSHPQAEWEIAVESVAELLELAGLVDDLQFFFPAAIAANAEAIRALNLTSDSAAVLREVNDRVEEVIEIAEGVVTERVVDTFVTERILSGEDPGVVEPDAEAERALVAGNLLNTLARTLNHDDPHAVSVPEDEEYPVIPRTPEAAPTPRQEEQEPEPQAEAGVGGATGGPPSVRGRPAGGSGRRPKRKAGTVRAGRQIKTWAEVADETVRLVKENAPPRVADAVVRAVETTIKTAPLGLPGLAATLWAVTQSNPVLLMVPGIGLSLAWIGYALWKRYGRDGS